MPPKPGPPTFALDVGGLAPDAVTVDVLARITLDGRRHGCRIALEGASRDLLELVAFLGLEDVLALQPQVSGAGEGEMGSS
jgi:hypothetical protein